MEVFKTIKGFENYEVSYLGNVRNIYYQRVFIFSMILEISRNRSQKPLVIIMLFYTKMEKHIQKKYTS